jgi:CDP-paratose 2-epimerase
MSVCIVTGAGGLIGSEAVKFFSDKNFDVVGIDNDMRKYFFGSEASTFWNVKKIQDSVKNFKNYNIDIRNYDELKNVFSKYSNRIKLVVHTAAQPSHDWAAKEPFTDFTINANGTLNLLEATRNYAQNATFIFTSTNKVYGDTPNLLPLVEKETRWEIDENHPFSRHGIDETMSIDNSKHSIFGASKVAADVMVQEYGKYFGMNTVSFRGGCLTGPAHSGAELHGFLAYLVLCAMKDKPYTIFGYKGKQVRDNIHSKDLINAFWAYFQNPRSSEVYNMGGGRHSNCSVLEAISIVEKISGRKLNYTISEQARIGDHIWYISDVNKFKSDYPDWEYQYDIETIIKEIVEAVKNK